MGSKVLSLFFLTLIAVHSAQSGGLKKVIKGLKSDIASLTDLVNSLEWKVHILWEESDWVVNDESSYLLVTDTALNWDDAQAKCESMGASLVSIESHAEQEFISSQIYGKGSYFLTAGNDISTEGIWVWGSSTERMEFTFWEPGQPQDAEDCLALESDKPANSNWHDFGCHAALWFICEHENNI